MASEAISKQRCNILKDFFCEMFFCEIDIPELISLESESESIGGLRPGLLLPPTLLSSSDESDDSGFVVGKSEGEKNH